ncbi:MAG: RrF2 family transcriptional regulator [Bacillota bacterium]
MNVSTRGRYGLRAMVDMAIHADEGPLPLRQIAERQSISESYLEQVFTGLRKAGLVKASRGAQGGYALGLPPEKITVGEILRVLEGPISPVFCVNDSRSSGRCKRESNCITHGFWAELRDHIISFLDGITLQDLAAKARTFMPEKPMYYI